MQLMKISPEKIMEHWAFIRQCIIRSVPVTTDLTQEVLLNIQQELLLDNMQCWFAIKDVEESDLYGVMTTSFIFEQASGTKNLLIYTVTITGFHPEDLWQKSYETLRKYAKSKDCFKIIAYSNQENILKIAKDLGADTSWYLVQLEV